MKRILPLLLALLPLTAAADYSIKTGTGADILMRSNVVDGVHMPVLQVAPLTTLSAPIEIELDIIMTEEDVNDIDANVVDYVNFPYDNNLIFLDDLGGSTHLNGYWHVTDGVTLDAVTGAAYTSGGTARDIATSQVLNDMIVSRVQLQITDTGTQSLYGTSTSAGVNIFAYNPEWPGERITLINYESPNSVYEKRGTIESVVLNSILYQTFNIDKPVFIPKGWFIAADCPISYAFTEHKLRIEGTYGTAPLILDNYQYTPITHIPTPINHSGTNLLLNAEFEDWTASRPDDWDSTALDTFEIADNSGLTIRTQDYVSQAITQTVAVTAGNTYALQITNSGSTLFVGAIDGEDFKAFETSRRILSNTESITFVAATSSVTIAILPKYAYCYYDISEIELIEIN
jgi:hypothetical protein